MQLPLLLLLSWRKPKYARPVNFIVIVIVVEKRQTRTVVDVVIVIVA